MPAVNQHQGVCTAPTLAATFLLSARSRLSVPSSNCSLLLVPQALNDSGLGAAVIGGGIDDELKQPIFGLGLKGVDPANVDKVGMWMDGEEKRGAGEGSRPLCHPALLK